MKHKLKITLKPHARNAAIEMRTLRGMTTPADFEGPVFENVEDFEVDGGFLVVTVDKALYAYPVDSVARFAVYKGDEE